MDPVQLWPQGDGLTQAWQSWQQAPGPVQPQRQLNVHGKMLVMMGKVVAVALVIPPSPLWAIATLGTLLSPLPH